MTFGQSSDENSEVIPQNLDSNSLLETKKQLEPKKKYKCDFCHERFRNKDALDRHMYHHTNEKKYVCSFVGCSSSYTNVSNLRQHTKRVHKGVNVSLQQSTICLDPDCPVMFSTEENMRRHFIKIHRQGDQYVCNTYGKSFHRKQQYKRHTVSHSGEYPYKCEVCGKGATNLKAHIRHRASHVHDCSDCGRIFKHWSGLVAHRKIAHVGEFKCETCNKVFISQKNLNYHQKVHLNPEERDVFQCPYDKCANYYFEKRNLMAHIRSKHEGQKFICGFKECGRQISTKQKLELHLKLHLSEKMGAKSRASSRKDKGKKNVSAVNVSTGVVLASEVQKALLENKGEDIVVPQSLLPVNVNSSDVSDVESISNMN